MQKDEKKNRLKDIREKIVQLRKVIPERGATEAEALNAIELANKLMEKYGICEEDLRSVEFESDMKIGVVDNEKKAEDPTTKLCANAIARFCEVKVWKQFEYGKMVTKFFGMIEDVEMAEFLYEVISKSMEHGWKEYMKGDYPKEVSRHKLYWSFRYGFSNRVVEKLDEMVAERQSKKTTGTDLVVLKSQLIEEAASRSLGLRFKETKNSSVSIEGSAYYKGQIAGDRVNLSRPVRGKENNSALN